MVKRLAGAAAVALLVAVPALAQAPAAKPAGTDPWYGRNARILTQPIKPTDGGFQIEWPKKDWMVLPSIGPLALVLASKKGDALIVVERSTLRQPLDPSDITDLFAQLEGDAIKEKQKPLDLQARVIDGGDHRLVAVQYQRNGALGVERVRQYSVPAGRQLYRLICISAGTQFLAYDTLFAHVAATFAPTAEQ